MARFRRTRSLEDDDLDWLGHVNNVVWVQFVIELATAHSEAVGLGAETYREIGAGWVVHRHEIDYRSPGFGGDRIDEETWIESMRGARSLRCARFVRPSDGAVLVEARTTWAFVDLTTGRPRRVPAGVADRFAMAGPPASGNRLAGDSDGTGRQIG